jgi:hypothetical protein
MHQACRALRGRSVAAQSVHLLFKAFQSEATSPRSHCLVNCTGHARRGLSCRSYGLFAQADKRALLAPPDDAAAPAPGLPDAQVQRVRRAEAIDPPIAALGDKTPQRNLGQSNGATCPGASRRQRGSASLAGNIEAKALPLYGQGDPDQSSRGRRCPCIEPLWQGRVSQSGKPPLCSLGGTRTLLVGPAAAAVRRGRTIARSVKWAGRQNSPRRLR